MMENWTFYPPPKPSVFLWVVVTLLRSLVCWKCYLTCTLRGAKTITEQLPYHFLIGLNIKSILLHTKGSKDHGTRGEENKRRIRREKRRGDQTPFSPFLTSSKPGKKSQQRNVKTP